MTKVDLNFVEGLTLEERADLVSGTDFWFTAKVSGMDPMLMTDGPSGLRKQVNVHSAMDQSIEAVCFPCSALTASSFDDQMLEKLGEQLGTAARAEKIGVLLGPGVNIKRSPLAGRNFEYFSEDPLLAGRMGTAYVKGVQSTGVGVSVKHFATNNREDQRFTNSSDVDERTLREIYLAQFERIVKQAHPATIMCSYNKLNGVQVSQNQRLLTNILRDEWGYQGLVMSDWGAVVDHTAAIKAGLDLEMPGKGDASKEEIIQAVKEGRLQESTLNRSALRVLEMAERYGHPKTPAPAYDMEAQHEFARQLADDSIVLLKNEKQELPLSDSAKLAVIGELAEKPRFEGGGSSHVNAHRVVTPKEVMPENAVYAQGYRLDSDQPDEQLTAEAMALAKNSDQVVFFAGFPEAMESEGFDKHSISLPANQNKLLEQLLTVNPHVVVVLQNGSAVEMPWEPETPAIVETYLAGEAVGEATWDILSGQVNPSGKLSETFPKRLADNPTYPTFGKDRRHEVYREGILMGYRYYDAKQLAVRFPFGHGLSYTTFAYQNLTIRENSDDVTVSFDLENTGSQAGKEVAQVYVANHASQTIMPIDELRDFVKVELQPGETKHLTLKLSRRAFAWYNSETETWEADNGQYEILVGSSSRDIRLRQEFELTIGTNPLGKITGETYVGELMENADERIKQIIAEMGLTATFDKFMSPELAPIFANIPLRSLTMADVDAETVHELLQKLNELD
ncbi:beta-glucosidase family protein [Limosilactobacillus mucosae]|uniref:Thermostable beta-glucosidase B n=1 Tax=Limosilactobacillus mucosae TaxID=97478 RepID=A0A508YIL6_LIMMU|nr:glycoside hydrolase family 3 C-terminal domain-containing protein [Limosilactobacillus mucosae]QIG87992.1 beta-glucosidase [Limosilactobacillus mucosae]VTZ89828.1 Thermostable beta-glucosidase B [Limosilactobacillus mucosae]